VTWQTVKSAQSSDGSEVKQRYNVNGKKFVKFCLVLIVGERGYLKRKVRGPVVKPTIHDALKSYSTAVFE
jgi:hypothetical protein